MVSPTDQCGGSLRAGVHGRATAFMPHGTRRGVSCRATGRDGTAEPLIQNRRIPVGLNVVIATSLHDLPALQIVERAIADLQLFKGAAAALDRLPDTKRPERS
jgi:hypothetical protein